MTSHQPAQDPDRDDGKGAANDQSDGPPGERSDGPEGRRDDDTDVERYRDSPGIGMFSDGDPPEPNEPG